MNLPFRIDELLAGSLPEPYRTIVKLEKQVDRERQAALKEVVPTDERVVMFIASKHRRRAGIADVYYDVGAGKGTFREVDGRVVPPGSGEGVEKEMTSQSPRRLARALLCATPGRW